MCVHFLKWESKCRTLHLLFLFHASVYSPNIKLACRSHILSPPCTIAFTLDDIAFLIFPTTKLFQYCSLFLCIPFDLHPIYTHLSLFLLTIYFRLFFIFPSFQCNLKQLGNKIQLINWLSPGSVEHGLFQSPRLYIFTIIWLNPSQSSFFLFPFLTQSSLFSCSSVSSSIAITPKQLITVASSLHTLHTTTFKLCNLTMLYFESIM